MTRALRERSSRESAQRVYFIRFVPSKSHEHELHFQLDQPGNRVLVWAETCTLAQDDVSVGGRVQVPLSFSLDN